MRFTKMQGAGNDFIIVDNRELKLSGQDLSALAARLCTRRLSLGGDALMAVDFPEEGGDLRMRFYNADGSEGEMCGNGARCLARYARDSGLAGDTVCMETVAGKVWGWRQEGRRWKIRLNDPMVLELHHPAEWSGKVWDCSYVELGSPGLPHGVLHIPELGKKSREELRPLAVALRNHPVFPKGANINFYDLEPDGSVRLWTFERGVEDFTLACGTGSGSTAAVLTQKELVKGESVLLRSPGGELRVDVKREGKRIAALFLTGDTNLVAWGEVMDEDLKL